jgi:hypothetical protein
MDRAQQDKANRMYYLNAGRCPSCGGKRPVVEGETRCSVCREKERQRKREKHDRWLASGLCTRCGKPRDEAGYLKCIACRDKAKAYYKAHPEKYNTRKIMGMCVDCGRMAAEAGKVLCKKCAEKRKARSIENDPGWDKKYERRKRLIADGLCISCGKPTDREGKSRCSVCLARQRDSTRKYQILKRMDREAEEARRRSCS